MIEGSLIARPLTEAEVQLVSARYFPGNALTKFTVLAGGMFNNTVRLDFSDRTPVVLRAGPVKRELLIPFELHLMEAEAEVDRLCEEAGIPCSHLLAVDSSKTLLDRDFMLVDCLDAVPLSDPSVPPEAKPALYRETGRHMAKLHQIKGPSFGRVWDVSTGHGFQSWFDALMKELSDVSGLLLKYELMEQSLISGIRDLFTENAPLFESVQSPALVHADLWEGNVLAQRKNGAWEIAAIIDGDRAYFGDLDYDFANPWMINEHFLEGYGPAPADTPDRQKKNKLYRLLWDMTDAYVWEIEYHNHENFLHKKEEVEAGFREISLLAKESQ